MADCGITPSDHNKGRGGCSRARGALWWQMSFSCSPLVVKTWSVFFGGGGLVQVSCAVGRGHSDRNPRDVIWMLRTFRQTPIWCLSIILGWDLQLAPHPLSCPYHCSVWALTVWANSWIRTCTCEESGYGLRLTCGVLLPTFSEALRPKSDPLPFQRTKVILAVIDNNSLQTLSRNRITQTKASFQGNFPPDFDQKGFWHCACLDSGRSGHFLRLGHGHRCKQYNCNIFIYQFWFSCLASHHDKQRVFVLFEAGSLPF